MGKGLSSLGNSHLEFDGRGHRRYGQGQRQKHLRAGFGGKDESVLNHALAAFHAAYSHSLGNVIETFKFVESQRKTGQQVVMNGNEALALGLIASGVRFGAGYPITPWSDVMEALRRELPK